MGGTKGEGCRLPGASRSASTVQHHLAQYEHGARPLISYSGHNTDHQKSSLLADLSSFMPSSAQVIGVTMTTVLAAAFMGVPRSQCHVEETFEDLGGTQYFKRVKVTDCEQDDCPLSVAYAPPRR